MAEGHKIWYFRLTLFLFQEIGILYCQNEATLMGQLVNWEAVKPSRRAIQRGGGVAVGGEAFTEGYLKSIFGLETEAQQV